MNVSSILRRLAALLAVAVVSGPGHAQTEFSEIVVFGASWSSGGNFHHATGGAVAGPPYHEGRFSNGPIWVDVLAEGLQLPVPAASFLGGTNYAWGGSESGSGLSVFGAPNVELQIQQFLTDRGQLSGTELIVLAGAAGDLVWRPPYSPARIANNMADHVRVLAAAGGTTFLMPNVWALGQIPQLRGGPSEVKSDVLARQTSKLLERELDALGPELGVTVLKLDLAGLVDAMLLSPEAYGITNVTEPACPACGTGGGSPDASDTVVPDPDQYLWWDLVHATRVLHEAFGEIAIEAVNDAF